MTLSQKQQWQQTISELPTVSSGDPADLFSCTQSTPWLPSFTFPKITVCHSITQSLQCREKKTHRKLFMFGSASTMNEMAGLCILEWSHPQISSHGWTFLQCHYGVWSCHCQQPWVSSRKRWARRNPFLLSGAQSMKISNGLELLSVDSSKETQSKGLAINLDVEEHSGVWPWMIANSNRGQWHLQSDGRFLGVFFFLYSYESS